MALRLLQLPPEILQAIFDHLDTCFFRQDIGRLTLCKQWFEFALPMCFKNLELSRDSLRKLVTSGAIENQPALKSSLEFLNLELKMSAPSAEDQPHQTQDLDRDLAQLATLTQRAHSMRKLRLQTWRPFSLVCPPDRTEETLSIPTIKTLLSVKNLTTLVLDLTCGLPIPPTGQAGNSGSSSYHFCPVIGGFLSTLRVLHVRLRRICPDVLKPDPDAGDSLRLTEVVINLFLHPKDPAILSMAASPRCGAEDEARGSLQLQGEMKEQAQALAARMPRARLVRILMHGLFGDESGWFDVLTGKQTFLKGRAAPWNEDGEISFESGGEEEEDQQEEEEEEEEELDDNFNGYLDDSD